MAIRDNNINDRVLIDRKIRSQDNIHFQPRLLAIDRIKSSYRDLLVILVIVSKSGNVKSPREIEAIVKNEDNFLAEYRKFCQSISLKVL